MQNLQIDAKRLWDMLMDTAKIGATPKGGICRLTLSDLDREVRDWFRAQCEALGCTVTVDEVGNMFALRPGRRTDVKPVAMGSHLDTQPTGGKFDGCLGVLAGLEVLKTLHGLDYETNAPLLLVNWTNEEGARFAPAMLGSAVFAGVISREDADGRADLAGITFGDALEGIGYRGGLKAGDAPIGAMFELHIEQGPILEAEGKTIGIVQGVQGIRWFDVTFTGQDSHSGSTPMHLRKNALLAAAQMIGAVDRIAKAHPPGVGTVGLMEVKPNSRNVIPGEVFLTVDARHPDDATLDVIERELAKAATDAAAQTNVTCAFQRILHFPPVAFDAGCIACVREGAEQAGLPSRDIVSGPGHDAAYVARIAPTTMIFVPCKDGISHNESEFTTPEDCAAGAQVLLNAVLAYDRRFAE